MEGNLTNMKTTKINEQGNVSEGKSVRVKVDEGRMWRTS